LHGPEKNEGVEGGPVSSMVDVSLRKLEVLSKMGIEVAKSGLVGGIPTPLKNINQMGLFFPIYRKNDPNHQPVEFRTQT
jgi:hypothetical protein